MARHNTYVDLKGCEFSLSALDAEERKLVAELQAQYNNCPGWNKFENYWTKAVATFYAARGLTRRESRQTAVYKIAQDLGNRLAIAAGLARAPDYRDALEEIIRTQFHTRREFCEATGLAEDMLSHVLAHRKHLSMETLISALARIGYAIRIVPQTEELSLCLNEGTDTGSSLDQG
jgi:hypothetical protein